MCEELFLYNTFHVFNTFMYCKRIQAAKVFNTDDVFNTADIHNIADTCNTANIFNNANIFTSCHIQHCQCIQHSKNSTPCCSSNLFPTTRVLVCAFAQFTNEELVQLFTRARFPKIKQYFVTTTKLYLRKKKSLNFVRIKLIGV